MLISERKLTSHVSNTQAAKKQAARLALILTVWLQTKQVICWGHCLLYLPEITEKTKWARNEKIPGGSHAVRYQFCKDTMRNQYKQLSSTYNYGPRMLWVL